MLKEQRFNSVIGFRLTSVVSLQYVIVNTSLKIGFE